MRDGSPPPERAAKNGVHLHLVMDGLVIHGQDHQASLARAPLVIGLLGDLLLIGGNLPLGVVESPARVVPLVDGAVASPARVPLMDGAVESPARVHLVIGLLSLLGVDGAMANPARAVPVHHGLHLLLGADGAMGSPARVVPLEADGRHLPLTGSG
jgi:hypothetical protein